MRATTTTTTEVGRRRRRRDRAAAAATALALLSPVTASAAAAAAPSPPPAPVALDTLCADVPPELQPFADVAPGSTFADAIRCQAHADVTRGVGPATYGPSQRVTRAQMASFVARTIDTAVALDRPGGADLAPLPAAAATDPFVDVPVGSVHGANVSRLAAAGIVVGGPHGHHPSSYLPHRPVTRAQMASFVARALEHLTGEAPDSTTDHFVDDETSGHDESIDAVAGLGIAVGTASGRFEPAWDLRRDQMAAFTMRTLAHLERIGLVDPLPAGEPVEYQPCADAGGFTISYPSTWHTDDGCSFFHPHPFEVPPLGSDEPIAAIRVAVEPAPSVPDEPGLSRDVVSTDVVIDGRPAVRHEYESDGGLWPDGTPITTYVLDLSQVDGRQAILVASTVGLPGFHYEANRAVLDEMAASIDLPEE